jgi:DNA polymerase (family 10)
MIAGIKEEDIYGTLGLLEVPPPEIRENTGEIQASRGGKLPKLIGYEDLMGDLQVQTNWTDGQHSIEEMAQAAQKIGLRYIAITDHTKSLAMTGGSDEKKLLKQVEEIKKIQKKFFGKNGSVPGGKNFRILTGAEVNIGKDGTLDIDDATLAKLDVVGAAVHSHFNLSRAEQTKRIIRTMENPHVDIIFHLTTRIINKREPIELDIDEIIAAAKHTKTVLEIDAFPDRLDIKDDYIRKCVQAGVKMSIDSDAHSVQHFKYLEMGIAQARRGWAEKNDIINAWPVQKMLSMLK